MQAKLLHEMCGPKLPDFSKGRFIMTAEPQVMMLLCRLETEEPSFQRLQLNRRGCLQYFTSARPVLRLLLILACTSTVTVKDSNGQS